MSAVSFKFKRRGWGCVVIQGTDERYERHQHIAWRDLLACNDLPVLLVDVSTMRDLKGLHTIAAKYRASLPQGNLYGLGTHPSGLER